VALGRVRALPASPKRTGCEHYQTFAIRKTQQVIIVADQHGARGVRQCGKLAIIRVWDMSKPLGVSLGSVATHRTEEI
jgi:hypothetical protein